MKIYEAVQNGVWYRAYVTTAYWKDREEYSLEIKAQYDAFSRWQPVLSKTFLTMSGVRNRMKKYATDWRLV